MGTLKALPPKARSAAAMVDKLLRPRGFSDERVLSALSRIPRHIFVPEVLRDQAYADIPLPIGDDQTISQPYILAVVTQSLELRGEEKVLEIGTGSGYQTAILAELAKSVFSLERVHRLAIMARQRIEELEYHNVSIRAADGALGWKEYAPFDRIVISASVEKVPDPLREQLGDGGILITPVGPAGTEQKLFKFRKKGEEWERTFLCYCEFVPFVS